MRNAQDRREWHAIEEIYPQHYVDNGFNSVQFSILYTSLPFFSPCLVSLFPSMSQYLNLF